VGTAQERDRSEEDAAGGEGEERDGSAVGALGGRGCGGGVVATLGAALGVEDGGGGGEEESEGEQGAGEGGAGEGARVQGAGQSEGEKGAGERVRHTFEMRSVWGWGAVMGRVGWGLRLGLGSVAAGLGCGWGLVRAGWVLPQTGERAGEWEAARIAEAGVWMRGKGVLFRHLCRGSQHICCHEQHLAGPEDLMSFRTPPRVLASISLTSFLLLMLLPAGLAQTPSGGGGRGIPVLAYHRFDPVTAGSTTVTTATFESQMAWLDEHHYRVVPLAAVVAAMRSGSTKGTEGTEGAEGTKGTRGTAPEQALIAITVDDGHRSVYTVLFPLVQKHRIPVTLFIYPSAISNAAYSLTWEQLREMKASGLVDIQSHTYWHPDFRKEKAHRTTEDYAAFVMTQLVRSRQTLDQKLGTKIDLLAWPYGILDPELEAAAARSGYTAAFAYAGGVARPGGDLLAIPRIPVANFHRGAGFSALLEAAQTQLPGSTIKAPHE